MTKRFFFLFIFLFAIKTFSQNTFYDINAIQEIDITFVQPNWDYQLDTSKNGNDGYIIAAQVAINGLTYDSVGIKYKGYSSYSISQVKNPLHIELNHIKPNQSYQGYTDIKLSNGWSDPSSIREVLSFKMLRNYMDAPQANFARVFINGNYFGLYSNTEDINKDFIGQHFYSSGNTFVKANPWIVGSFFSNLDYLGPDSALYTYDYDLKSTYAWKDLIDLCDTLENNPGNIQKILDVDRALWMLAFNNVTVNLDSYSGAFIQNYYLYKDDHGRFNPVSWDMNMNFGGFNLSGTGGPLSISGLQNLPPMLHQTDTMWPLIKNLLADTMYIHMYIAHMRTITNEFFFNNVYQAEVTNLQSIIDSSVQADPNGLYTYSQFQQSLTTNIPGNFSITPGLYNLVTARTTYLQNCIEFQQVPPTISATNAIPAVPSLNDTVWITCSVSNANTVQLGYRYFKPDIFNRINMFDDGNHMDGIAGDGIYGIGIPATSAIIQYYIYADNANAGMFSPQRAEFEFYTINVNIPTATFGEIAINEFVVINQTGSTDLSGKHEDWIELYNNTNISKSLFGLYLSDDPGNIAKWPFPVNAIIPANGFIIVWADEDNSSIELHCNFKLSGSGEYVLLSTLNGLMLDSIAFGPQSPDVAMARCPDGTGNFSQTVIPTFNASNNCTNGIDESSNLKVTVSIYPNPSSGMIRINSDHKIIHLELYSTLGSLVKQKKTNNSFYEMLDITYLKAGIYFLKINNDIVRKIIKY